MRKVIFIALLLIWMSGCATIHQTQYGNYLPLIPVSYNKTLAEDAVKQLQNLYPPASTRFDLQQTTPDTFGTTLVESMRGKGYAVFESKPAWPGQHSKKTQNSPTGTTLRYILDQVNNLNLYRLTLLIGNQAMTRAYLVQNSTVHPAGKWSHKE
ncbi:MAG: conjugal transfer protein TrbH [Methylobacter sp.]|nr:conjugal transfer protein TrbH [Methylobacter sp.]